MKINKYISIDQDIFNELSKENNASELINRLVKEYFDGVNCKNVGILRQDIDKIKQEIKEKRKKMRQIQTEIIKIQTKEKQIIEKVRNKITNKPERDPISDPDLWIAKEWDKRYPQLWNKHLKFIERGQNNV